MMINSPHTLRTEPTAPIGAASSATSSAAMPASPMSGAHDAAPATNFAALLRQSQAAPATPAVAAALATPVTAQATDAPAAQTDAPPAATNDEGAPETDPAARPHSPARAKARSADKPAEPKAQRGATPIAAEATDAHGATDEAAKAQAATDPRVGTIDPALSAWLAALHAAPAPAEGRSTGPHGSAEGSTDEATGTIDETTGGAGRSTASADLRAAMNDKAGSGKGRGVLAGAEQAQAATAARLQEAPKESAAPLPIERIERTDAASVANVAVFAPAPGTAREAATAPLAVTLPTPVDAPDFATSLGLQMSVLARDGVHEAELHLNPADMGPVSVQIVMDGTRAQVDFGADVAATRQAIEAGLPELASALREAGFTLTGGGVSQHSPGRGQAEADDGRAPGGRSARRATGAAAVETLDATRAATRRNARIGGLDLYA